ncbi:MAG: hypothetical protein PHY48_13810 [Candidatus Cloacimonetes bacterium]|nr:hypothetical protein [Candidatus Cloacimonadota bacterium]
MISTNILLAYMYDIGKMASLELIGMNEQKPSSRLIIPQKRDETYRLSEQEFRVASINAIQNYQITDTELYFSVETPTGATHMGRGTTPMSARFDVSLYERVNDKFDRVADMEFKAHNAPPDSIKKDIDKLIQDNHIGAWFHVLQNCNSATFKELLNKFSNSLETLTNTGDYNLIPLKQIFFVFLVVDKRFMISQTLNPIQLVNSDAHFQIDYNTMHKTQNKQSVNGWLITRF